MADILIIDDDEGARCLVASALSGRGHTVRCAGSLETALDLVASARPDLVLAEPLCSGVSSWKSVRRSRDRLLCVPYIVVSRCHNIRAAVRAMRAGAADYLTKPVDIAQLLAAVRGPTPSQLHVGDFGDMVSLSAPMAGVCRILTRIADKDATVLVLGESGTGKELVARTIHRQSRRRSAVVVAVNCGAVPPSRFESEFFGHEKGAFTDARAEHAGKFEQAHRGTLFLDEVGELPSGAQAKLLRVLQDRQVTRLGGRKPINVDVRVIAATNRDLESAVSARQFRDDLFWRLNVVSVTLPPLRERQADLPILIDRLMHRLSHELRVPVPGISPGARQILLSYHWPNNVRELENTLQRAMVLCEGTSLSVDDLPQRVRGGPSPAEGGLVGDGGKGKLGEFVHRNTERLERARIRAALDQHGGNRSATAESLGINRKTLLNKMRSYGLLAEG